MAVVGVGAVIACRGEPRVLEPRSPPARTPPAVALPPGPVPPHHTRVVLGGTDGPLRVSVRADSTFIPPGYSVPPTRSGELCTTPCVVDLPVGRYKLYLVGAAGEGDYAADTDTLTLSREGVVYYLRAPGRYEPPVWLPVVPAILLSSALILVLAGGGVAAGVPDGEGLAPGLLMVGAGVGIGVWGGIWSYDVQRGAIQSGASSVWSP